MVEAIGSWVGQVGVRHDAKRADGGETATVVAVQLVRLFTIPDDLPLQAPRQIETVQQDVARVVRDAVACVPPVIALQFMLVAVAALTRVVAAGRRTSVVLDAIAPIVATGTRSSPFTKTFRNTSPDLTKSY